MEEGHDRRFLRKDPLRFPIKLYPFPLVQTVLRLLYQSFVIFVSPPLSLSITD